MPRASLELNLADSGSTELLGQALAQALLARALNGSASPAGRSAPPGAVLHLRGELGAGKTTCVRSLLRALGAAGPVRSPTYALVETYRLGAWTCVHADLYRLQSEAEVDELGLRDLIGPGCLLMVEWPEKGGAAVPPADVELTLRYAGNGDLAHDGRQALLSAATPLGGAWLLHLGLDTSLVPYLSNLT